MRIKWIMYKTYKQLCKEFSKAADIFPTRIEIIPANSVGRLNSHKITETLAKEACFPSIMEIEQEAN